MATRSWHSDNVTITLDLEACKGHGNCANYCPGEVYELADGKAVAARIEDCMECCTCVEVCPQHAIEHSCCI